MSMDEFEGDFEHSTYDDVIFDDDIDPDDLADLRDSPTDFDEHVMNEDDCAP